MYLFDTNVVSEMRKARLGRADPRVAAWLNTAPIADCYLSVITLFEIELGVSRLERRNAQHGHALRRSIDGLISGDFARNVILIDADIAIRCARLNVPEMKPERDAWIAATAIERRLTVVTRNTADFRAMLVPLIDPWQAGTP